MGTTQTYIDLARLAYTTDTNTAQDGNYGDLPDAWASIPNTVIHVFDALLNLTNGQLLVGKSGAAVQKVYINGDASMNETGLLTINSGAVTPSKMAENGKLRTELCATHINLNTGATFVAFAFDRAATLLKLRLLYLAGGSPSTTTLTVDKGATTGYFVASTTTISLATQYQWQDLTLANTTIAADDVMVLDCAGAGPNIEAQLWIAYYYND